MLPPAERSFEPEPIRTLTNNEEGMGSEDAVMRTHQPSFYYGRHRLGGETYQEFG
jgi:hypothetical protein